MLLVMEYNDQNKKNDVEMPTNQYTYMYNHLQHKQRQNQNKIHLKKSQCLNQTKYISIFPYREFTFAGTNSGYCAFLYPIIFIEITQVQDLILRYRKLCSLQFNLIRNKQEYMRVQNELCVGVITTLYKMHSSNWIEKSYM